MTTDFKDTNQIRDVLNSPVPQYFNEDLQQYAVETTNGSIVTGADFNFRRTRLLRDKLGSSIPQLAQITK